MPPGRAIVQIVIFNSEVFTRLRGGPFHWWIWGEVQRRAPPHTHVLYFHALFGKILSNYRLAGNYRSPLLGFHYPSHRLWNPGFATTCDYCEHEQCCHIHQQWSRFEYSPFSYVSRCLHLIFLWLDNTSFSVCLFSFLVCENKPFCSK